MTTDAVGGIWTYVSELAEALERDGYEVVRAAIGPQRPPEDVPYRAGLLEWQPDPWRDLEATGEWLLDLAGDVQPDVVHVNSFGLAALGWRRPVVAVAHSCVCSWHEAVRGCRAGREWDRYRDEVRAGLIAADAVVAPTAAMLADLLRLYDLPPDCGRVIHNGVAGHESAPAEKEALVLGAGRLWDEAKGMGTLDRAAASVSWPVAVAGDAGTTAAEHLRLLGALPRDELRARIARAAIFVHPALYEPFGLVVLEAALAGCALVLGDIASLRELWDGGALFVPPGDADALAAAIERLTRDAPLRERLARAAQDRARTRTPARMAAGYAALYATLPSRVAA